MSLSPEELKELGQKIASNPDLIYDLEPAEAIEVRKYINPLGGVVSSKKSYVNLSLINWKEKYLRRLHMTAMVGYLYRTLEEYEPVEEAEREKAKFEAKTSGMDQDSEEYMNLKAEHEIKLKMLKTTAGYIIRNFLNRNFNYNPDHHLRGSHSENSDDPERVPKNEAIRKACETSSKTPEIETKLQNRPDATFKYMRGQLLNTYQSAVEATETIKSTISVLLSPDNDVADKQGILIKKYKKLLDITEDLKKIAEPLASTDTLMAWKINPPADVFHQFDRYLSNHYEQLRDVCAALYNEKPDFEYAAILYDAFKTPEAAREYRIQHEAEFRTEVLTIESGAVTLIGPFKENRQRIDFFNKNTEVMKRMMEQLESDHKLGKDLMEKQVRAKKKKNVEEAGPDDPGITAYARTMNVVRELGAKQMLTREEQLEFARAKADVQRLKEDYEVPDDAIQVDMFYPETSSDGNTELKKTKFFTQAEAPLHLQEGSEYSDKYQPARAVGESVTDAYKTKVITDRHGKKVTIQVPKKDKNEGAE